MFENLLVKVDLWNVPRDDNMDESGKQMAVLTSLKKLVLKDNYEADIRLHVIK